MNDIVFINNRIAREPFTTSAIIAEYALIEHRAIKQLIRSHKNDLEEFGILTFQMSKIEGRGRPEKNYKLNELQACLLITYLQNTAPVRAFKKELVYQFYLMREELMKRQKAHAELKPIRRELTDAIRDRPDYDKWAYKRFIDLAYKTALGKTAAQLRKERGANPKANISEYLSAEELQDISRISYQIAVLIDLGISYGTVKDMLAKSKKPHTATPNQRKAV